MKTASGNQYIIEIKIKKQPVCTIYRLLHSIEKPSVSRIIGIDQPMIFYSPIGWFTSYRETTIIHADGNKTPLSFNGIIV